MQLVAQEGLNKHVRVVLHVDLKLAHCVERDQNGFAASILLCIIDMWGVCM